MKEVVVERMEIRATVLYFAGFRLDSLYSLDM